MQKSKWLLSLFFAFVAIGFLVTPGVSAKVLDLPVALNQLTAEIPAGRNLAFVGIDDLQGRRSALGLLAMRQMEPGLIRICKERGIKLLEREGLQLIIDEWKLEMSGITASDKGAQTLLGADFIITGNVSTDGDQVDIYLRSLSLEDGRVISSAKVRQPRGIFGDAGVAKGASLENKGQGLSPEQANYAESSDGKLKLWTSAHEYRIGSRLTVFFQVAAPSYVTLIDVMPDGEKTVIFPNPYQPNNFCQPGITYQVPSADGSFVAEVTGPAGTDRIMAVTSKGPDLDKALVNSRGIKLTRSIVDTTERRAIISIKIK